MVIQEEQAGERVRDQNMEQGRREAKPNMCILDNLPQITILIFLVPSATGCIAIAQDVDSENVQE